MYGVYDYKSLPATLVATFFVGLREDSRIKMAMAGVKHSPMIMLMSMAVDALNTLVWMQSEDGRKGENRPSSITQILFGEQKAEPVYEGFADGEAFEKRRTEILENLKWQQN